MGKKLGWNHCGNFGESDGKNKSEPNACHGLVQFKAQKSVELHSPSDRRDHRERGFSSHDSSMTDNAEPTVTLPGKITEVEGGKEDSMEVHSPNSASPSIMLHKPSSDAVGEKDVRAPSITLSNSDAREGPDRGVIQVDGMEFDGGGDGDAAF